MEFRMKTIQAGIGACLHFVHKNFLWLLIAAYALAALAPACGLALRDVSVGEFQFRGRTMALSLPVLMLAFLLFNAGLGVRFGQLKELVRKPLVLSAGLLCNILVPIAFIWVIAYLMRNWHDEDEAQLIIVGLALVAAMPIAGASTAWSQNADGDMALSLGLMLLSTFLSPLTTPLTFKLLRRLTFEDYTDLLFDLGSHGTGFLFWVVLPVALGIVGRAVIGERHYESAKPALKLCNLVNLLLLNYSNASVSLPQTVAEPVWHFLSATLAIVIGLCVVAFASGWVIAKLFRLDRAQRVALMFGLGMNNNGTGLVLASMVLVEYPEAMLPLIFYTLVQHLVAGCVDYYLRRRNAQRLRKRAVLASSAGLPMAGMAVGNYHSRR
jgi:BASS family bile acid:Na+ symporter